MTERVLLVGGGGREHAIARAVTDSDRAIELHAAASNRNPGIEACASSFVSVDDETDAGAIVDVAESIEATVAIIGPEAPLAAGVTDALEAAGIYTFAPTQEAARIETDKMFQREFMQTHGIPGCPEYETFESGSEAAAYVESLSDDVALKPKGLTGGKGVRVTGDQIDKSDAKDYIRDSEWEEWVIEERLVGEEFTIQAFVANGDLRVTPAVQDHKRAYEGDEGPNTGGMGSYSDTKPTLPFMTEADYDAAVDILTETVAALPSYTGVLYGQFMLTAEGPKVVEFNARFGDPEAMNTLPVMETDFVDILLAARDGNPLPELTFTDQATVCKYAVPDGYPVNPASGARIDIDVPSTDDALLFYASVDSRSDGVYTTTSRSLAVVGLAADIAGAEANASAVLQGISDGLRVRHDIGTAALVEKRIDHMQRLRQSTE